MFPCSLLHFLHRQKRFLVASAAACASWSTGIAALLAKLERELARCCTAICLRSTAGGLRCTANWSWLAANRCWSTAGWCWCRSTASRSWSAAGRCWSTALWSWLAADLASWLAASWSWCTAGRCGSTRITAIAAAKLAEQLCVRDRRHAKRKDGDQTNTRNTQHETFSTGWERNQ